VDVEAGVDFVEIAKHDHFDVGAGKAMGDILTVLISHHYDNVVIVEVGAGGEFAQRSRTEIPRPVQCIPRPWIHFLTDVPSCRSRTRDDDSAGETRVVGH